MSILSKLLGSGAVSTIGGIANVIDQFVETSDEKRAFEQVMLRMQQEPAKAQAEINKIEAAHSTIFVAGWRPFIGWVCGVSLGIYFIPQFALGTYLWFRMSIAANELLAYPVDGAKLFELVLAMLGMGALRTYEKKLGVSR